MFKDLKRCTTADFFVLCKHWNAIFSFYAKECFFRFIYEYDVIGIQEKRRIMVNVLDKYIL